MRAFALFLAVILVVAGLALRTVARSVPARVACADATLAGAYDTSPQMQRQCLDDYRAQN